MHPIIIQGIAGAIAGGTYGISSYLASADKDKNGIVTADELDLGKLSHAVVYGLIVGVGAAILKVDITTASGYFAAMGGTLIVDKIVKTVRRRLFGTM